jgi:hypothetical protein
VNGVVCVEACADNIFWIEENLEIASMNIRKSYRVDVVDEYVAADHTILDPQVAAHVANNNVTSERFPFERGVENLVQISVESESFFADFAPEFEVVVALFEGWEGDEFGICAGH